MGKTDMSTDSPVNHDSATQQITLTRTEGSEWWVAKDRETGVATQGKSRQAALENLDEAVALHKDENGDTVGSWEEEREVLEDLGIDADEVKRAREENDDLPEFMQ